MNKLTKARKYNSPKLQELLDEISPLEMEKTKVKMQLAARIEDLMKIKGFSKSQFAEIVDKNPSEITKWLSGTQNLTLDILTEIAFALDVTVSALFGKKQVQIVYRNEIVVNAVVMQPPVVLTTPVSEECNFYGNYLLSKNQKATIPVRHMYQS